MTPELWQRLKPLFHEALEREPEQRAAYIDTACGEDDELRMHLKQLVDAEQQETGSLDAPLANLNGFFNDRGARFKSGELVLGRFRIVRPLGRGGMGEVYEAEDLQLGIVALKTIRHGIASSADAFERFRQEVQLARRVSGSQVCRIHELYLLPASGTYEATAFLTMEYLEGITLYEKIHRDGAMPWKEALGVTLQICEGLQLIHEKGIIHRDLKTGNIMLCKHDGATRIVLMDFGLARDFGTDKVKSGSGSTRERPGKTMPQVIMGTPEYMAPEQFEGKPVSPPTDIYALGIILYELVTGLHPYAADTPVAAAIRRARPPMPPSLVRSKIPKQCDRVIQRCLEFDPEKRFQSANDVAKALRAGPANLENLKQDRPWVIWFASAMLLGLICGSIFFYWQSRQYYRPNAETLRWYDAGVAALREGNNVKATRSLQQAVAQDSHFVMAHARLAEAWSNLDFDGNAQRELLLATPGGRHLQPIDRMYLEAIHATITKDHPAEIATYRQILTRLPPDQQSSGYVDLGMAYERSGDPSHALESYTHAAALNNENPAPFVHTAVLQSRQHHVPEANQAFNRAQTLLSAEMNQEGLADLDYELGYAASDTGNLADAKSYLNRSLDEAGRIPSVQLQIRVLTQLSIVASRSDAAPQAAQYAEQAIRLARENQLDAWAAFGLVRLATAQSHLGELREAESSLQEALNLARQTQQLRAEALANITLANLMNQEKLPDRVLAPAQAAFDYYQKNGYFVPAISASLLLIRSQRDNGHYAQALASGKAALDVANKSGIRDLRRQSEELLGNVLLAMEQYPEALTRFQNAKNLADTASSSQYEAVNIAEVLWRLGRYTESEEMLHFTPASDVLARLVDIIRTQSLLSQRKFTEASRLSTQTLKSSKISEGDKQELQADKILAESYLGMKKQALADWATWAEENKTSNPVEEAVRNLVAAEVALANGQIELAHDNGVKAADQYEATGQLNSELRSLCLVASAEKAIGNQSEYDIFSEKAVDIVSKIQQTWSPQASKMYLSRPDLQVLMRGLPIAAQSNRRSL